MVCRSLYLRRCLPEKFYLVILNKKCDIFAPQFVSSFEIWWGAHWKICILCLHVLHTHIYQNKATICFAQIFSGKHLRRYSELKSFFWKSGRFSLPDFTQIIPNFPTFFDDFLSSAAPMVNSIFHSGIFKFKISFTLLQNMQPSICKIYLANNH